MTKYFGLVSFLILVCGLLFTVVRWRGGLHMTFSQHVARSRSSIIYYSLLFAVALPLLYLFFTHWFVLEFKLPSWFSVFVTISVVMQFLCTLIPEVGGWKTLVHRVLASISGVTLLPLMIMLIIMPDIPSSAMIFVGISFVGMMILLAMAFVHQKGYKYSLLLQIGYYALFFASVFLIAYC